MFLKTSLFSSLIGDDPSRGWYKRLEKLMTTAVFTCSLLEALRKGSICSCLPSWKEANVWYFRLLYYYIVVQPLSHVWLFETQWTAACQASLSFTISWSLLKLTSIESVMPSNHLVLCCPLFLLPSIFPSIRVFSNDSALCIRWPKYWSFSFSISPSNEYSGLISFRINWLDLLAYQGTLKSLLQHHSSKSSILWHSTFFMVELSYPYRLLENHSFDYMDLCW